MKCLNEMGSNGMIYIPSSISFQAKLWFPLSNLIGYNGDVTDGRDL
jgi:hypothetical protein